VTGAEAADRARQVAGSLGYGVTGVHRLNGGACHHVFELSVRAGEPIVVRLGRPATARALRGGIAWNPRLAAAGVPVPRLLHASPDGDYPWMVLERLPGRDLGDEIAALSRDALRELARAVAGAQARVAGLPRAGGYGYAVDYGDPALLPAWRDVVDAGLERARTRLAHSGACDPAVVDDLAARVAAFDGYLRAVEPVAFLDDTTTRNVMVHKGRLSGIVDTDYVCFGDRIYTLGLTRMALLSRGLDPWYTDAWAEALALDPRERAALDLYTACFCVDFLGEIGQAFSRDTASPADPAGSARLLRLLDDLLRVVDGGRP
jgi:Ser/Thr protein kinase RdoA (MazF antagonist)